MGKVVIKVRLTNTADAANAAAGRLDPSQVRSVEIEGLVDTGAMTLAIPADVAQALGLRERHRRNVRLADGTGRELPIATDLTVEILGRDMACDAIVLPVGATVLIGQIPLQALDLVVHPASHEVTVNPASPDMPTVDLLRVA